MARASRRLGVHVDDPMVWGLREGYTTTDFLNEIMRPALVRLRASDCTSSEYLQSVDLDDVQVRSFRRTATKAMRLAGVDVDLIDLILQWKRDKNSVMRHHYDSVDLEDTMSALRRV